jgi:thiol:disulfide interchange protein
MKRYKILSLPTFIFLGKNGKEILRFTGIVKKETLIKAILENKEK